MENDYAFSQEEWENCLKVLSVLKDDPFANPDNQLFGTLVTKVYKNAKKKQRSEQSQAKREQDATTVLSTQIARQAINGVTTYSDNNPANEHLYTPLEIPQNCYCCNESFQMAHWFYARMCSVCAEENYHHRFSETDLRGRNVVLTGGRVKIGYATALRILRCGANLILTTRFPGLAMEQLQAEEDYENWKDRLFVYGLDLRNFSAIQDFIVFCKTRFGHLDILINNAAQTIRYTPEYYAPLIYQEENCLIRFQNSFPVLKNNTLVSDTIQLLGNNEIVVDLPLNRFGQPVDNREKNSWNSSLTDIELPELIEVNLINHIAPYMLIKELKPLLEQSPFEERFIVNVTSSEGMFSYTNKTAHHPHTNMTKAALNMLTLTSGQEFAKEGIYMTAVDVGWISTGARESLRREQFDRGYIPPLDPVDGASRIMHPIIRGMHKEYFFGLLLKNYKVSNW